MDSMYPAPNESGTVDSLLGTLPGAHAPHMMFYCMCVPSQERGRGWGGTHEHACVRCANQLTAHCLAGARAQYRIFAVKIMG
jgi:hypothetical protein